MGRFYGMALSTAMLLAPATAFAQSDDCRLYDVEANIYFETGSRDLQTQAVAVVDQIVKNIGARDGCTVDRVTLDGHADRRETETLSPLLSLGRSMTVSNALTTRGIVTDRISIDDHGSRDLADADKPTGAINRRVAIMVTLKTS